jgi:ferredoxin-NADP reductase
LSPQVFTYVPNTSFRGPEHLLVQWDPALNPERTRPQILQQETPVRIGEPSAHALGRTVKVDSVTAVAERIVKLRLRAPDGRPLPRWAPGSHIDIQCGDTGLSRQYSLCGDPAEREVFEVAVLNEPAGRGGSAWLHQHVKAGDSLKIRGPRNHFRLDESCGTVLFVAGGIGITPISAMARRAKALGLDYALHYSGRTRASMAMLAELAHLHGPRLSVYVSAEGTRNHIEQLLAARDRRTQIYACGPASLLKALEAACVGWPDDALHIERFESVLGKLDPALEHAFEVELKDSGVSVRVPPDQTLLQALRGANIDVQSDCEEGLCGSCEVRVLDGAVDHRDVVLTRAEKEANSRMMACCSRARGSKIVLEL